MSSHEGSSRPGGLTALAVLNFVFAGLGIIVLMLIFAMLSLVHQATGGKSTEELANIPGAGMVYLALAVGTVNLCLLIVSGVGYLKQKKFLGKVLGTAYACIAIVFGVIQLVALKQPFGISQIIGFIYPVITLALLNTTFKDDFVNP